MSQTLTVTFSRSAVTAAWDDACYNLLQFAEQHGVAISAGCRYGDCGTCTTDVLSGEVEYLHETGITPFPKTCLPCSCKPATDLVLDC